MDSHTSPNKGLLSKLTDKWSSPSSPNPVSPEKKSSFWKPTSKVPGTVKPVKSPSTNSASAYPLSSNEAQARNMTPLTNAQMRVSSGDLKSGATLTSSGSSIVFVEKRSLSDSQLTTTINNANNQVADIRIQKLQKLLKEPNIDMPTLRKLCWQGIPAELRPMAWRLLLDYLPTNQDRRESTLERKRKEYCDCVPKFFDIEDSERTSEEKGLYKQIQMDVPRTHPNVLLFHEPIVQQCLARVLYIWGIRHPASGYVQGINDLATPFFVIFLQEATGADMDHIDITKVPTETLSIVEADTYWCMTKLLDGIQDNYTFAQPGIQRMIYKLGELIKRIDAPLHAHLQQQEVHFIEFSFRWMNCLLMRELPLPLVIRVWDTYFAELETFSALHIYASAAFLCSFSEELRRLEFQDIMLFLKNPPTSQWTDKEIEMMLSQAFLWKSLFEDSPKHLENTGSSDNSLF